MVERSKKGGMMAFAPLVTKFEADLEYLAWRSEVHLFSKSEINQHFFNIRDSYIGLITTVSDKQELDEAIKQWSIVFSKMAERHQYFYDSGIKPINSASQLSA